MARGSPAGAGDLDMDGQTSVFEAFVAAARGVELFYAGEGRMATERALLEETWRAHAERLVGPPTLEVVQDPLVIAADGVQRLLGLCIGAGGLRSESEAALLDNELKVGKLA